MDDQELIERRRVRQRRIQRATSRSGGKKNNLLASPITAVFTMSIALGSILVFWGGFPSWALLAMGFGAVLVLIVATLLFRGRSTSLPKSD